MVIFKNECPICYEDIDCLKLECGHSFCIECLASSMQHFDTINNEFTCAMCRCEITDFKNDDLNNELEQLHIRIKIRKIQDEEEYLYGITTYYYCIYINWFLTDPNIQNYPKNLKFYTYEEMI